MWQDYLLSFGGFVLTAFLLPTAFGRFRPPRLSSVPVSLVLAAYVPAMATLGLYWSTAGLLTQALLWTVIAVRGPSAPAPDPSR